MLSDVGSFRIAEQVEKSSESELNAERLIKEDSNNNIEIVNDIDENMSPAKGKPSTNKNKTTSNKSKSKSSKSKSKIIQYMNDNTGLWCKYDLEKGRTVSCKRNGERYANVPEYKSKRRKSN